MFLWGSGKFSRQMRVCGKRSVFPLNKTFYYEKCVCVCVCGGLSLFDGWWEIDCIRNRIRVVYVCAQAGMSASAFVYNKCLNSHVFKYNMYNTNKCFF